jgi:hypothetical protein
MMVQYKQLPAEMVKYLIIGSIIFGLILVIPYEQVKLKDAIILSVILTITVAIVEHATILLSTDQTEKFDMVSPVDVAQKIPEPTPIIPEEPTLPSDVAVPEQPTPPVVETVIESPIEPTPPQEEVKPEQAAPQTDEKSEVYKGDPNAAQKDVIGSREKDGVITDESKYSTNQPYDFVDTPYAQGHHVPVPDNYKTEASEYGYSFLPPEKWYTPSPYPPMCISEKKCPVCPVFTSGTPIDVKEWHESRRITQPDGINTLYIKEKLNSGR